MGPYIPRLADELLRQKLARSGAVLVRGPKWCGKTTTCEQVSNSVLRMRDPDTYAANLEAAETRPSLLLRGEKPRLIDEWQVAPVLWDAVIGAVDMGGGAPGQFLLTGSATPFSPDSENTPRHTGTGRIARLDMDPMTLEEMRLSTKEVSLTELFAGALPAAQVAGVSALTVEEYAEIICSGGWPAPVAQGIRDPGIAKDYLESLCEADISEATGQEFDPTRSRALMHSIARNSAQEASLTTILTDVKNVGIGMSDPTLRRYLAGLRKLFVIENLPAWAPTLRSRTPLRSSGVWHLCDPSLAAAALEADADALLGDLLSMGYLFESLCVRDLRVYARRLGGRICHYRDKGGLEVDVIVSLDNGQWAGIEVKLGGDRRIAEGAENLLKLASKINTEKMGEPAFLMVLTGSRYAYQRSDGVLVVPLGCLAH